MVPVIRVNAEGRDARLSAGAEAALAGLSRDLPLVILIHGYIYSPRIPERDPHRHVLAAADPP